MTASFRLMACAALLLMLTLRAGYAQADSSSFSAGGMGTESYARQQLRQEMEQLHTQEISLKDERERLLSATRRLHEKEAALHEKMKTLQAQIDATR